MVAPLLISGLFSIGSTLIDRLIPDPDEKAKAQLELFRLEQSGELSKMAAQAEITRTEAAHKSIWVAGARPFILWVCGAGIAYTYILQPFLLFGVTVFGGTIPELPRLESGDLMALVTAMLGIGTMRSFDKIRGVETTKVG